MESTSAPASISNIITILPSLCVFFIMIMITIMIIMMMMIIILIIIISSSIIIITSSHHHIGSTSLVMSCWSMIHVLPSLTYPSKQKLGPQYPQEYQKRSNNPNFTKSDGTKKSNVARSNTQNVHVKHGAHTRHCLSSPLKHPQRSYRHLPPFRMMAGWFSGMRQKMIIALVGNHPAYISYFLPISRHVPIKINSLKSDPFLDHLQISTMKNKPKNEPIYLMDSTLSSW